MELKLVGEYGLKNKREVWRVMFTLSKIRKMARELLTLSEKDPKRIFEGNALLRRLTRMGVLDQEHAQLDYVLALTAQNFLDRRLQTLVVKLGHAKSMHHARSLIRHRHIKVSREVERDGVTCCSLFFFFFSPGWSANRERAVLHGAPGLGEAHCH